LTVKRRVRVRSRYKAWRERFHLKPIISVLMYLLIPLISIYCIMLQYPLLAKERFYRMIEWIVPLGAGLFCVTLVQERYEKGTKARLVLDALFVGLTMAWLFGFLGGKTVVENTYGGWRFAVDVWPVVAIALFGTSLNFVHDTLEYMAHKAQVKNVSLTTGALVRTTKKEDDKRHKRTKVSLRTH
jgi:hypothetical protein